MTGYSLITLVVVVVVGVGLLVASVPFDLTVLTAAGAGYLTCLGIRTLASHGRGLSPTVLA